MDGGELRMLAFMLTRNQAAVEPASGSGQQQKQQQQRVLSVSLENHDLCGAGFQGRYDREGHGFRSGRYVSCVPLPSSRPPPHDPRLSLRVSFRFDAGGMRAFAAYLR
jgi:hypothetical protein